MSLIARMEQEYIVAYKAKDTVRLSVLRLLKTALKNFQVEHLRQPTDDDALDIIGRQCKQRQDSIDQFKAAGRQELVDKESAEMAVLLSYMPARFSEAELAAAIAEAIKNVNAAGIKDMGKVMQALTAAHKGRFDGKAASEAVKAALQALAG